MIVINLLIFIGSCVLLIKAGEWAVKSLIKVAKTLKWSEFLFAFCLMAFTASLPELFIGLNSAFHRLPQLSFGNIIGANILNLTLAIAVLVLMSKGLELKNEVSRINSLYAAFFIILPLVLMADRSFSRIDGIIMLLAFFFYFQRTFRQKERFVKIISRNPEQNNPESKIFLKDLGIFFGSIALLLLSAEGIIRAANFLAIEINLPLVSTGIILLGLGIVVPEIIFGIKSLKVHYGEIFLEDFFGTIIINSGLVLGLVGLISPLRIINLSPYVFGILFSFFLALVFAIFAKTGRKINKREAFILVGIFIVFIIIQILIV